MLRYKRKVLLLKIEGTYGVDATPVAATDALLVRNLRPVPLDPKYEKRDTVRSFYANDGQIIVAQLSRIAFEIEMAGAGTSAITVAKYAAALRMCALAETIGGADVTYAPITGAEEAASIYYQIDGKQHKMLGCRGNLGMRVRAGSLPVYTFDVMGMHVQQTDAALTPGTFTGFQKPVAVNNANTTPFTLHTFAGKFREFTFDMGNQVFYRNLPNSESVVITGRNPTGKVSLESELNATKDWQTIIKAMTLGALTFTQGIVAFNKVTFAGAQAQLTTPDDSGEEEGVSMTSLELNFVPSAAGNDEYSIKTL